MRSVCTRPSAPFALGSYAAYRPGQTAFEGIEGRRVGNLHFCGEHTSVAFQGLMEGACATGALTAQVILHDMGLPMEHIMTALGGASPLPTWPSVHLQQRRAAPYRFSQQLPQAS